MTAIPNYPKRLIEVDLPIARISAHAWPAALPELSAGAALIVNATSLGLPFASMPTILLNGIDPQTSGAAPGVLGASAGWLVAPAVCMPEGKNRALTVIQRSRQAFTSRGAWIQLGSSQAPTKAVEKTI